MRQLINRIFGSLFRFFTRAHSHQFCYDIPNSYKSNRIYLIGGIDDQWLITFKCPCGCKEIINLNLLKDTKPCWNYTIDREQISISPSIWRTKGCKSHFFLKRDKIKWV